MASVSVLEWLRGALGLGLARPAAAPSPAAPPSSPPGSAPPSGRAIAARRAFAREPDAHPSLGPYRTGVPSPKVAPEGPVSHHVVARLDRGPRWSTYLAVRARDERAVGWSAVDYLPAELSCTDDPTLRDLLGEAIAHARLAVPRVTSPFAARLHAVDVVGLPGGACERERAWSTEGDVSFANGWAGTFVAYEYAHGVSLAKLLQRLAVRRVAPPAAVAARVARDVARALADAWPHFERSTTVAPSRVFVTFAGRVVLSGLAHDAVDARSPWLDGPALASPASVKWLYAAPERLLGKATTATTPSFSIGALLAKMLTGVAPFGDALNGAALQRARDHALVEAPLLAPSKQAHALLELARAALDRDPSRRPSPAAIADHLEALVPDDEARLAPVALRAMARTLCADDVTARARMLELGAERAARVFTG